MDSFEKMLDAFDAHAGALMRYRSTKVATERKAENSSVDIGHVSLEERERTLATAKQEAKEAFDAYVRELIRSSERQ